jgi:hypothetical protein
VFDENTVIIFNRMLLFLLPKTLLKGTLRDLVFRDPVDDVVAMAKAKDINSGLAESMVFTLLDDPNKKLTLTEKSSRTISDIPRKGRWSTQCPNDHLHKGLSLHQRLRLPGSIRYQNGLHQLSARRATKMNKQA